MTTPDFELNYINEKSLHTSFKCPLCNLVLRDATNCMEINCRHSYCNQCMTVMKLNEFNCKVPNCKYIFSSKTRHNKHLLMNNLISQLEVYCFNNKKGCIWTGKQERLDSHIKNCLYDIYSEQELKENLNDQASPTIDNKESKELITAEEESKDTTKLTNPNSNCDSPVNQSKEIIN